MKIKYLYHLSTLMSVQSEQGFKRSTNNASEKSKDTRTLNVVVTSNAQTNRSTTFPYFTNDLSILCTPVPVLP